MLILGNWVGNTALYPPAYIYAGQAQTKQEKRAIQICEALYKFTWGNERNILGELRECWRSLNILCVMNYDGSVKPDVMEKSFDNLLDLAIAANNTMTTVFKQHQDLNKWKNDHLAASNAQLKEAIQTYKHTQMEIIKRFKKSCV